MCFSIIYMFYNQYFNVINGYSEYSNCLSLRGNFVKWKNLKCLPLHVPCYKIQMSLFLRKEKISQCWQKSHTKMQGLWQVATVLSRSLSNVEQPVSSFSVLNKMITRLNGNVDWNLKFSIKYSSMKHCHVCYFNLPVKFDMVTFLVFIYLPDSVNNV